MMILQIHHILTNMISSKEWIAGAAEARILLCAFVLPNEYLVLSLITWSFCAHSRFARMQVTSLWISFEKALVLKQPPLIGSSVPLKTWKKFLCGQSRARPAIFVANHVAAGCRLPIS